MGPKGISVVETVDTYVYDSSTAQGSASSAIVIFTVPRGKTLQDIRLYPYIQCKYPLGEQLATAKFEYYIYELMPLDWRIFIDGSRLEHVKITPLNRNETIALDKVLKENQELQMTIDLTNVANPAEFQTAVPAEFKPTFMMRVSGKLIDSRQGANICE